MEVLNFIIGYWVNRDNKLYTTIVVKTSNRSLVAREFKKHLVEIDFLPAPFTEILTDEQLQAETDRVENSKDSGIQVIEFHQKDEKTFIKTVR